MSTNGVDTTEDTDMVDYEGEKVVTMMDVLQQQEEFEEDANAVLGASDDKNCTYSKGYIKRQAVYACLTCCSDAKTDPTKRAGVCLACSLNCHENHELIELYTRRNFRCDCGNTKFNSHPCQFTENKTDLNEDNKYNQNFIGIYCTCHRPYPDPDAVYEDEMIQCTICEDWLHASHLEATLPGNDQYSEMICKACMEINEFLHDYSSLAVNVDIEEVDIITINETSATKVNMNEKTETNTNGLSLALSPFKQEVGRDEIDDITMESCNNNDSLSENTFETTNVENESMNGITDKYTNESNAYNETEKDFGDNGPVASEKTGENKENSNEPELPTSDTSKTADQINMFMETEEIQASPDKGTNILKGVFSNTNEELENIEPNESSIVLETYKKDTLEYTEISNEADNVIKNLEHGELEVKTENQFTEKIDEQSAKTDPFQTSEFVSELDTASKNLEISEPTVKTHDQVTEKIDEESDKTGLLQSTETETKNLEAIESTVNSSDLVTEKTDKELDETSPSESTEFVNEVDITAKDLKTTELTPKNDDHITEKLSEVTNKNNALNTDVDRIALKNLEDSEAEANTENEQTQQMDELIENIDLKSTEVSSKVNRQNTAIKKLEGGELKAKTGGDCLDTISNETDVKSTAVDDNTDSTYKNLDGSDLETNTLEQINGHKFKDSSDAQDHDTKELLDLISDVVNKSEEDLLSKYTTDTYKEINSNEEISEAHITNENVNLEINDFETEKCNIKKTNNTHTENEHKRKLSDAIEDIEIKKARLEGKCKRPKGVRKIFKGATFWTSEFRQKLCTCNECLTMYKDLRLLFLLDPEDTVTAYETLGKEKINGTPTTQYEQGLQALSSLDRVQQINALTEYNLMRDKLLEFFKSFKERKQVVTEEDIRAFFAGMKPRREPDGVYFCR